MVYFNVDYTQWLTEKLIWEADRAVINPATNKVYNTIFSLLKDNEPLHQRSKLLNLFGIGQITINDITTFVPSKYIKATKDIWQSINKISSWDKQKAQSLSLFTETTLKKMYPKYSDSEKSELWNWINNFFLIKKSK